MKIKLAEALLRRKQLQEKVAMLKTIDQRSLFEVKVSRKQVTDTVDDIVAQVPKLTLSQFTREYDWHAKQLRLIDAAIQQANWTSEIDVDSETMEAFSEKK